jgi:hypothetical protein
LTKREPWIAETTSTFSFISSEMLVSLNSQLKSTFTTSDKLYYNADADVYATTITLSSDKLFTPLRDGTTFALIQGSGKTASDLVTLGAKYVNDGYDAMQLELGNMGLSSWSFYANYPGFVEISIEAPAPSPAPAPAPAPSSSVALTFNSFWNNNIALTSGVNSYTYGGQYNTGMFLFVTGFNSTGRSAGSVITLTKTASDSPKLNFINMNSNSSIENQIELWPGFTTYSWSQSQPNTLTFTYDGSKWILTNPNL